MSDLTPEFRSRNPEHIGTAMSRVLLRAKRLMIIHELIETFPPNEREVAIVRLCETGIIPEEAASYMLSNFSRG